MRERLIELLDTMIGEWCDEIEELEPVVNYLLANGVVVLPCKVGDTVYDIVDGAVYPTSVISFAYYGKGRWACRTVSSYPDLNMFGTRIFLTREEAEKALKGAEQ